LTAGPGRAAVFSLLISLFVLPASVNSSAAALRSSQVPDAAGLVAKIGERLASHPKLDSWQAKAHSTTSYMNSAWKPKKTTTTEKTVTVDGGLWSEEILSAAETEDGKTRDVTKKLREKARARAKKQKRQSADKRKNEQRSRGRRSVDMIRDEALPFGPGKRPGYDFTVKGTADLNGMPVILLQSRSRVRSAEKLEGRYYIHPDTFDVLRAELTIAKRPGPLKRMEIKVDFLVLPEGHMVMKKAVIRIHIVIIIKNIRIEAVETYSDYVVPGKRP
jgi:hypothetical protein